MALRWTWTNTYTTDTNIPVQTEGAICYNSGAVGRSLLSEDLGGGLFRYRLYYCYEESQTESHTVTFADWNGTPLKTEFVSTWGNATPPPNPNRPGYRFTGWSGTYTNVTSNRIITATYVRRYVVTFLGREGEILKTQTVDTGGNATAPTPVNEKPWHFESWSRSFTNVTSNITVESEWYWDTGLYYNDVMIKRLVYNGINLNEINYNGSQVAVFEPASKVWVYLYETTSDPGYIPSYQITSTGESATVELMEQKFPAINYDVAQLGEIRWYESFYVFQVQEV